MRLLKLTILSVTLWLMSAGTALAQQPPAEVVYYGFDPDIVTNYVSENRRSLGYLRVSVELMLPNKELLKTIEYHEPLILDTIIGILSKQNILLYSSTHGVGSASREFSVSSACIYKWKERLSKMGTSGLFTGAKTDSERELKRLERENRELKRIVAEKELALQIPYEKRSYRTSKPQYSNSEQCSE